MIKSQLVSVAISFLRNFGLFSGASGILGLLSSGVAGLAGDRWYVTCSTVALNNIGNGRRPPRLTGVEWSRFNQTRLRARQERSIASVRDGLAEGGGAFGMGFYRGVTGIVTKPLEGAKSRGAYGALPII